MLVPLLLASWPPALCLFFIACDFLPIVSCLLLLCLLLFLRSTPPSKFFVYTVCLPWEGKGTGEEGCKLERGVGLGLAGDGEGVCEGKERWRGGRGPLGSRGPEGLLSI